MAWMRKEGGWPTPEDRTKITPEMVAWHDDMLAENWDATVKYGDIVWVLGDLTANPKSLPEAMEWIKQRAGTKHLILGNHDPAHPMNRDSHKWQRIYSPGFASIQQSARRKIDGQDVLLSHFPYVGDGDSREDRDVQWRLRNEGLPILHGHVHTKAKVTEAAFLHETNVCMVKQIHVGVDAHDFTPVSLETITELLDA